jgi:hypothetical protein
MKAMNQNEKSQFD